MIGIIKTGNMYIYIYIERDICRYENLQTHKDSLPGKSTGGATVSHIQPKLTNKHFSFPEGKKREKTSKDINKKKKVNALFPLLSISVVCQPQGNKERP